MADFSRQDIEEAKKRVREMQMRVNSYIGTDTAEEAEAPPIQEKHIKEDKKSFFQADNKEKPEPEEDKDGSDSSFIILILLLLLSHEGADSKLLLALLYLLL